MDTQILDQLMAIRSLLTVTVWLVAILVVALVAAMALNYRFNLRHVQTGDFFTRGNALLMKDELDTLLKLCDKHLRDFPADASAHWLKGTAHYRRKEWNEALLSYRRADELQPGFAIGPPIAEIEEKIANARSSPGLKAVPPATPIHEGAPTKNGKPKDVDV